MNDCIYDSNDLAKEKPLIYLIHGYTSRKEEIYGALKKFSEFGFDIVSCDSLGSGKRKGNYNEFVNSLKLHSKTIKNLKRDVIVIGHSLGGVIAINLAKIKTVKKVFAISSPYNFDVISNPNFYQEILQDVKELFDPKRKFDEELFKSQMMPIFPSENTYSKKETAKIHLIYSKHDYYIPITQFNLMKQNLNIPDERTKIIKFQNHISILRSKKTFNFIKKTINNHNKQKIIGNKRIIITIPHGFCLNTISERHCDILAQPFANSIEKQLKKCENATIIKIESSLLRTNVDKNRSGSENTIFWTNLRNELDLSDDKTILLDIHSAPPQSFSFEFEILIFSLDIFGNFDNKLSQYLRAQKILCLPPLSASEKNAIINTAITEYNIKNIALIEINEKISPNRMEKIAKTIAHFVINYQS